MTEPQRAAETLKFILELLLIFLLYGGVFYDQFGSYDLVWWVGAGVGAFSAVIHLPVRETPLELDVTSRLKEA